MKIIGVIKHSSFFCIHPIEHELIRTLTSAGYKVDIFFAKYPGYNENVVKGDNISLFPMDTYAGKSILRLLSSLSTTIFFLINKMKGKKYSYVIAIEPLSLFEVYFISFFTRTKIIYLSLEVLIGSELKNPAWKLYKKLEAFISRRVSLVITQDKWRRGLLKSANNLFLDKILLLPNAESGKAKISESFYLHDKLGISREKKILLHPGSIGFAKRMIVDLNFVARQLSEEYVIVIHAGRKMNVVLDEIDEKIVFSSRPVPYKEIKYLYASSYVGLAIYVNYDLPTGGDNIEYMGFSSGKFNMFMKYGKPTITTGQFTFKEIFDEFRCGVAIDNIRNIHIALAKISGNYEMYQSEALRLHNEKLEFSKYGDELIATLCNEKD